MLDAHVLHSLRKHVRSATGVSEVGNMAYMTRLGLWGPGSAFKDFDVRTCSYDHVLWPADMQLLVHDMCRCFLKACESAV